MRLPGHFPIQSRKEWILKSLLNKTPILKKSSVRVRHFFKELLTDVWK